MTYSKAFLYSLDISMTNVNFLYETAKEQKKKKNDFT